MLITLTLTCYMMIHVFVIFSVPTAHGGCLPPPTHNNTFTPPLHSAVKILLVGNW